MNFRRRTHTDPIGMQLAPMIDVILFLLTFFLLTWNIASNYEADLNVKVPLAKEGKEPKRLPGEVIVNIHQDGKIVLNRRELSLSELREILLGVYRQYPDQTVIIRADENTPYKHVVSVIDLCQGIGLWNIAFPTIKQPAS
ncbi:MAG: biopolymer transporter ExbD [Methylacidiphilales bacterium]|nr:biopolymer transporter ExbD [Candidatus Methylacidiphilales bacterium]MDW8349910.1 biopolymer transporter ExbD [Verrucomicrobiae bacterium]